jgi:hypothetical protein
MRQRRAVKVAQFQRKPDAIEAKSFGRHAAMAARAEGPPDATDAEFDRKLDTCGKGGPALILTSLSIGATLGGAIPDAVLHGGHRAIRPIDSAYRSTADNCRP